MRRGLARSRGHARELIEEGTVRIDDAVASKASHSVDETTSLSVEADRPHWVSRAAAKLVEAFTAFGPRGLTARGRRCLDVGASTGGFTQVLLHEGARQVTALDVGHGQLVPQISSDPRVEERSGTTIRGVAAEQLGGRFDLVVADVSFISLTLLLGTLAALVERSGDVVVLVKPQFEVGRERLGKNGVVRSAADRAWAITEVAAAAIDAGLFPRGLAASPLLGSEGNAEFLLWLGTEPADAMAWEALVKSADDLSVKGGS